MPHAPLYTKSEILDVISDYPTLSGDVDYINNHKSPLLPCRPALAIIRTLTRENMSGELDAFYESFKVGENLSADSPIFVLRKHHENNLVSTRRPRAWYMAAITIKAWNAHIEGKKIDKLRYSPSGVRAEEFPTIITKL